MQKNISDAVAVGYLRVSTDKQENGIEVQRSKLMQWEMQNRIHIVHFETDDDVSGAASPEDRPGFVRLLDKVKELKADWLVISSWDRIARDTIVLASIELLLRQHKCQIIVADEEAKERTPEQELMKNLLSSFAQFERSLISRRTKNGLEKVRAKGIKLGRPAYGDKPKGRRIAAHIWSLYEGGMTKCGIVRELNNYGPAPMNGGTWTPNMVTRILKRPELRATVEECDSL